MKKTAALFAIIALTSTPLFAAQTGGFVDPDPVVQSQLMQKGGGRWPNRQ